jgi:RNA polymerase sigma factor (sigma-70 family)
MNSNEIITVYFHSIASEEYHRSSHEYEYFVALEDRARRGEADAKQEMIKLTLRYISKVAATLFDAYGPYMHDDYMDLVQEGNLVVVETLERALQTARKGGVIAYLCGTAKLRIRTYCMYKSGMINIHGNRAEVGKHIVESLDAKIGGTELTYQDVVAAKSEIEEDAGQKTAPFYQALYQPLREALDTLTEKQRYVVDRHYGLDGGEPETLLAISKRKGGASNAACRTLHFAKKKLRKKLEKALIEAEQGR